MPSQLAYFRMTKRTSRRISLSSAYIGSGNRTEVFSRKPRQAFAKLSEIYKEELRSGGKDDHRQIFKQLSDDEKKVIRERILKQRKRDSFSKILILFVSIGITAILIWILVIWLKGYFL